MQDIFILCIKSEPLVDYSPFALWYAFSETGREKCSESSKGCGDISRCHLNRINTQLMKIIWKAKSTLHFFP